MKYKLLGRSGLRVSEICLGTMTFGTEWGYGADEAESRRIYDTFRQAGGNFIDTANRYTEGTSERYLGEFIKPEREKVVLATKYSLRTATGDINDGGNSRKNLMQSFEQSLKRLQTDYIDLLYLHAWDFTTPEQEVMRGLDDLVRSGKVLYIGISDTPAWIVSRCNTLAELMGWSQFIALQIEYSLLQRTPERDLIPMAKAMGLGVTAWGPLAGGALTGKYLNDPQAGRLKPESARLNDRAQAIAQVVVETARQLNMTPAEVALNWVRRDANNFPIVGSRNADQLKESLNCVKAQALPPETIDLLNYASQIELGFPHEFLKSANVLDLLFGGQHASFQPPVS